jgi:hypothetical protein
MDNVTRFIYKNREYSGYIVASLNELPHYYWFVFNSPELQKKIGDEVGFMVVEGKLTPTFTSLAERNSELFSAIEGTIERYISNNNKVAKPV